MSKLNEFYWKNEDKLELIPYGRLLSIVKIGDDRFWIVRPITELNYENIYNLNHPKNTKSFNDIFNSDFNVSRNWERMFVFLTDNKSPIYKDAYRQLKSLTYPSSFNVKPNQAKVIDNDMLMMNKLKESKIPQAKDNEFYSKLLDSSVNEFMFKTQIVIKEYKFCWRE